MALEEWVALKRVRNLNDRVKEAPLEFKTGYSAAKVRAQQKPMIILVTSVWMEFLRARPDYFEEVKSLLEGRMIIGLEWVFGELLQGPTITRERDVIESYWRDLPKLDESGLWLDAGRISCEEKLYSRGIGLIDCAILAAARRSGARIWTLDGKLAAVLTGDEKYTPLNFTTR